MSFEMFMKKPRYMMVMHKKITATTSKITLMYQIDTFRMPIP